MTKHRGILSVLLTPRPCGVEIVEYFVQRLQCFMGVSCSDCLGYEIIRARIDYILRARSSAKASRESVRPRMAPRSTLQDGDTRPPRQRAQVRRGLLEGPLDPSSRRSSHVKHVLPGKWNTTGQCTESTTVHHHDQRPDRINKRSQAALFADDSSMWKSEPNVSALSRDVQRYLTETAKFFEE